MTEQDINKLYPEHAKLRAIRDKSQAVCEFIDWLSYEKDMEIAVRTRRGVESIPGSSRKLVAEFFDIDENKLEDEKVAMLDECRKRNNS